MGRAVLVLLSLQVFVSLVLSATPSTLLEDSTLQPDSPPGWAVAGAHLKRLPGKAKFGKFDPEADKPDWHPGQSPDGPPPGNKLVGPDENGDVWEVELPPQAIAHARGLLNLGEGDDRIPPGQGKDDGNAPNRRLLEVLEATAEAKAQTQEKDSYYFNIPPAPWVASTTTWPARTVGFLSNGCSASLFGVRLVFTAAHCLYNTGTNTWTSFSGFWFQPGKYSSSTSSPYGTYSAWFMQISTAFVDLPAWSPNHDWGIFILNVAPAGGSLGYLGYAWRSSLIGIGITNNGYPSPQWYNQMVDRCTWEAESAYICYHRCDIWGGSSGSPLYDTGNYWIYGAQSGHCTSGGCMNSAGRITEQVFNTMNTFRANYPN